MSRIGKQPVAIPDKVTVTIDDRTVTIKGPKGELTKTFNAPLTIGQEEGKVSVEPTENSRFARAMHGTARSIIDGMVKGVVEGYKKNLEVKGVGFRAQVKGKVLNLNLGYSHDINHTIPEGVKVTVTENTKIAIEGPDKQVVGMMAAELKHYYKPEPYKGKGVHIEGEHYRRKEGKKAG